jgi:MFS superfamily sulfate permease-like transporter
MNMNLIKTIFPIAGWIAGYKPGLFKWDLITGITLAMFVLPTFKTYASLEEVPAQYGIYFCITGGLFFAFLTNTPQCAIGPISAISLMAGTATALLSGGDPGQWAEIAPLTAFAGGGNNSIVFHRSKKEIMKHRNKFRVS